MARDALDEKIEEAERLLEHFRAQVEAMKLRLGIYREAAKLRPNRADTASPSAGISERPAHKESPSGRRGGRQPGAISRKWRTILRGVAAHYPAGATPADIASFGPAADLPNLKPKDARQQAEKYVAIGYMEHVAGDRYRVTEAAIRKYALREAGPGTDNPSQTARSDDDSPSQPRLDVAPKHNGHLIEAVS
jgi:hypothetical protein